jgi:hypothetical protein
MRSVWHPRTKVGAARLVGLLAVILTLATIALWTLRFLVLLPPHRTRRHRQTGSGAHCGRPLRVTGAAGRPLAQVDSLLGVTLGNRLGRLLSVGVAWYLALAASPLALVGLGSILYLAAAVMMIVAALTGPSNQGAN